MASPASPASPDSPATASPASPATPLDESPASPLDESPASPSSPASPEEPSSYGWGVNSRGQLGSDNPADIVFAPITTAPEITYFASGTNFACGLQASGEVACWGVNTNGQCGNGSTGIDVLEPTVIYTDGASGVTAGESHACLIDTQSQGGKCWGLNSSGQLGTGDLINSASPVAIMGIASQLTQVTAGGDFTCALTSSNAYCWGSNAFGQVGVNSDNDRELQPVALAGPGWTALSAGFQTGCGIQGGAVKCWGSNSNGQVGNGNTDNVFAPVSVQTLSTSVWVSTWGSTSCAVETDGALFCWGAGSDGQLGTGNTTDSLTPVSPSGPEQTWSQVSSGGLFTCAVTAAAGDLYCWGSNSEGQLGIDDGTVSVEPAPVGVPLASVTQLSGRTFNVFARAMAAPLI
ncbi:hypothetical protein H632_c1954p1 [Helicosporidium sp. ATCC 50920]|nr:hypothetical protein H632_c1954p1 [Helicosporidium sp. ATCC 50920]|eukprot:KDD73663.1 hypothetical protein H632_c1954p1 [Helicosporidium sp. ATCC 50920]